MLIKKYTIFLVAILLVSCGVFTDPNYSIQIGNETLIVGKEEWEFMPLLDEVYLYSRNYSAREKGKGERFEQVVTVFLNRMSEDRRAGEKISDKEYVEAFVVHPMSVTVRVRVDHGDYWVMSRQTFDIPKDYPDQTNLSYRELLFFEGMENNIDNTRFILNNEFKIY